MLKRSIVLALLVMSVVASVARADSVMTPATRDSAGRGTDVSIIDGYWHFTVTDVVGKPALLVIRLETLDGEIVEFASGKPRLGNVLTTFEPIPAGTYKLISLIHGGNPHDGASVTVAVDTP